MSCERIGPANPDLNRSAGPILDTSNISYAPEIGKSVDNEAVTERAAIMQFDGGLSKYRSEQQAAELYGLTAGQREAIFPLPCRAGFEAVLFMARRGFKFIPWDEKENRPAVKWAGENRSNFTTGTEKLREWSGAGFKRFMYLPGPSGFIGLDIDVGHADNKDGLQGFYNVLKGLTGKTSDRLPSYLRDLPHNFPCYTRTPRGGLHIFFKYSGACKVSNLTNGDNNLEVKYSASCLSLGEKTEGVYTLCGDPTDAPDLPPFLVELINPPAKPQPHVTAYRRHDGKFPLEKILDKVLVLSGGHNLRQKDFAWRAAYFGYSVEETLNFVRSRSDVFGNDSDTETVIRHAWNANPQKATV
jgi:hypothetical protein